MKKNIFRYLFFIIFILKGTIFAQLITKSIGINYNMIVSDRNYNKFFLRDLGGQSAHIRFNQNYGFSFGIFSRFSRKNWDISVGPNFLYRRWDFLSEEIKNYFPLAGGISQTWQQSNIWTIELPILLSFPVKITNDIYCKPLLGYSVDYLVLPKKNLHYWNIPNYDFAEVFNLNKTIKFNHAAIGGLSLQTKTPKSGTFDFNFQIHLQMLNQIYFTHKTEPEYKMGLTTRSTSRLTTSYTSLGISWSLPY